MKTIQQVKKTMKNEMVLGASSKIGFSFATLLVVLASFNCVVHAARRERTSLPERTATLTVKVTFDGEGNWRHSSDGTYSDWKFHRAIAYTVPLKGSNGIVSGFKEVDNGEQKSGPFMPNFKRYLVLRPRDQLTPVVPRTCGTGTTEVLDQAQGMAVGDPGMPPLVPVTRIIKGGGAFPSGDKTVTESDLCDVMVAIDNEKHVMHLKIDGTDSTVKVEDKLNDLAPQSYNLPLQGHTVDASVMKQLTFTDHRPNDANIFEGQRVIERFNTVVDGPDRTSFPLKATVEWRVVLNEASE